MWEGSAQLRVIWEASFNHLGLSLGDLGWGSC